LYKTTGKYLEAIELFKQVLESYTKTLGDNHASTITVKHNLASTYKASGSPDQAISTLTPSPALSPSTIQSYILLALCHKDLNNLTKAEEALSLAESFITQTYGESSVRSVNLLNAKGLILKSSQDYPSSEQCFLK
jgi:tetratricopeptide (TPR) repeat protein